MNFKVLNLDKNYSSFDLANVITDNHKTSVLMEKEIKKLRQLSSTQTIAKTDRQDETRILEKPVIDSNTINSDFKDKIEYYYYLLDLVKYSENIREEIISSLPNRNSKDYDLIVMRLKLELLKNIKNTKEFIFENKDLLCKEDTEEFLDEINLYQTKLKLLSTVDNGHEQGEITPIKNNMYFSVTSSGSPKILSEIQKISKMGPEFCSGFLELFESIENGSFKNVKRLLNNNKLIGVAEVRGFKTRVIFDRIGAHDYAVITAFIKKCDSDNGYKEFLQVKVQNYLRQKSAMTEKINNEEYRSLNKHYTEEIFRKLGKSDESIKQKRLERGNFNV